MDGSKGSVKGGRRSLRERFGGTTAKVIAAVGFVSACIGIYQFLSSPDPAPALSAEESRLVDLLPPKLGTHCQPYETDESYSSLVVASVKCQPIDEDPDAMQFFLHIDEQDQRAFVELKREEVAADRVGCNTGFPYAFPWTDREGTVMGELICANYSDNARLYWSYDELLVTGTAAAPVARFEDLQRWWQRQVRFDGGGPSPAYRRQLLGLLPPAFGRCRPLSVLLPVALSGVFCYPGKGITSAGAELFPNERLLEDYLELQAGRSGIDEEGCDESPFSHMEYGMPPDYEPVLGQLVCHPEGGTEWFSWSADNPRVYAFAARQDNDFRKLYWQWSNLLYPIEGLEPPESAVGKS